MLPTLTIRRTPYTQSVPYFLHGVGEHKVDKYTIHKSILNPKAVKLEELRDQYIVELKMVGFKLHGSTGYALMASHNSNEIKTIELDMDKLWKDAELQDENYVLAAQLIHAKETTLSDGLLFPLTEEINNYSHEEWVVYYLSDNESFYIIDYSHIRRFKNELREQARLIHIQLNPADYKREHFPTLISSFVSSIKIQKNNVKISYGNKSIIRYDIDSWVHEFRKDVGRTRGSEVGGLLRRIKNGKLTVNDGRLFHITDGESIYVFMSIQTGAKGGQTFKVPDQSIDMYIDIAKEYFGEDMIVYLTA